MWWARPEDRQVAANGTGVVGELDLVLIGGVLGVGLGVGVDDGAGVDDAVGVGASGLMIK